MQKFISNFYKNSDINKFILLFHKNSLQFKLLEKIQTLNSFKIYLGRIKTTHIGKS